MSAHAILTDVTRCLGPEQCGRCVARCHELYNAGELARLSPDARDRLSWADWTDLVAVGPVGDAKHLWARRHCLHCLNPACVSVCPVGALIKTPEGPVAYRRERCIGCRYCMAACPFGIPRYEWQKTFPLVQKCFFCHEKMAKGELDQPACTKACQTEAGAGRATEFGERDRLLEVAAARIRATPGKYLDHVYGLEEAGGTSVLYLTPPEAPLDALFPAAVRSRVAPFPDLTRAWVELVPGIGLGVAGVMGGLGWIIRRRMLLQAEEKSPSSSKPR